jgi:hypothetical protein
MLGLACLATAAYADVMPITLQDGNSTAMVDPDSQAGMFHWDIQGQNQLNQQWFWYGVGNGAVKSIDTLTLANVETVGQNKMIATYLSPGQFSLSIDYTLTGGSLMGAGQSANADIAETIKISNLSGAVLPLHFYQYSYFNLQGASTDMGELTTNMRGKYVDATQFNPNAGLTETVLTPGADHGEIAPLGVTLAKLNSNGPVTLGPNTPPAAPGAITWAFEWDFAGGILPGASPIISKDKWMEVLVVPEPSVLGLLGVGLTALALRKRNRVE